MNTVFLLFDPSVCFLYVSNIEPFQFLLYQCVMFLVCKCKRFDHWPGRFQLALFERGFCLASIVRRSAELKLDVWKDNFQFVCKYEFQLLSDERPYRCHLPDCGRAFIQLSNLQQHLKNHDAKVLKARNKLQCAFSMWNLSEIFFGIRHRVPSQ